MSKVFEALQKAEKDKVVPKPTIQGPAPGAKEEQEPIPAEVASLASMLERAREGQLPALSPWLLVYNRGYGQVVEQIKRLRTHILHSHPGSKAPRVILVTSASAGEGKSLVSANLAASIAQGIRESAWLVDADLRHGRLHRFFGMKPAPGLSDYLAGELDLEQVLRETGIQKLSFIASGSNRENPIELISSERMKSLLEKISSQEEETFVVLDSTPALLTSEPRILAQMADGVVFVVRHDLTPRNGLKEAMEYFPKEKILALVFNDVPPQALKLYGHAYGAYYYGGAYKPKDEKTRF